MIKSLVFTILLSLQNYACAQDQLRTSINSKNWEIEIDKTIVLVISVEASIQVSKIVKHVDRQPFHAAIELYRNNERLYYKVYKVSKKSVEGEVFADGLILNNIDNAYTMIFRNVDGQNVVAIDKIRYTKIIEAVSSAKKTANAMADSWRALDASFNKVLE